MRKITIDNSVIYNPKTAKTQKKRLNQKQKKLVHFQGNKLKTFHKIVKNSLKMWQRVDLQYLNE